MRSAAKALLLRFGAEDREALRAALGEPRALHLQPRRSRADGEVVLVMGIPGAGKSRIAEDCVGQGYTRLNRDVRGGSIRDLCAALDDALASGTRTVVLDNTWLTRATRSHAVDVARRRGIGIRCVWLEIRLADAQRNVVERMLARRESLPTPEEVRQFNGRDGMLSPTAQMRALRELEPPESDEGFADVERRPFVRVSASRPGARGVFVAAAAVQRPDLESALAAHRPTAPHLVFDWHPDGDMTALTQAVDRVRLLTSATVCGSLCPHPAGPPVCWCRPGLLGLVLQFTRRQGIDAERSVVIGTSATHRSMAQILGCEYVAVSAS